MSMLPVLLSRVSQLQKSEKGVTMVEYGILVAVIALVVIGGATIFGTQLSTFFMTLGGQL